MNTSGYVNLDYVVSSVLNETESDERQYERLMQIAIEGYSNDLNLTVLPSVKTVSLEPDDKNTVVLPKDYVDYVAIGIEINGKVHTLTNDESIKLPESYQCDSVERSYTDAPTGSDYFFEPYNSGGNLVHEYGIVGGINYAYYRIDHEHGRIILMGNSPSRVVLEYVSSGVGDGATIVSRRAVPALKAYIFWKSVLHKRDVPMNTKEMYRRDYIMEKSKLYAMNTAFTLSEFLDDKYKTMKQTPKF